MIRKLLLTVLSSLLLLLNVCQKDKNPMSPEQLAPGSRNYVWELDTLDMPMNYLSSVWGASPTDIWAVGGGGTYKDRLQHYDGAEWSAYTKEPINIGSITVFGFSVDDVWMGGQAGWGYHGAGIWHYDGINWSRNYVYDVEGAYTAEVQNLWGTSSDNLYASGCLSFYNGTNDDFRGFLLHYNGKSWSEVVRGPFDSQFLRVRKDGANVFVHSVAIGLGNDDGVGSVSSETLNFYRVKDKKLEAIYTAKGISGDLSLIGGKAYFVIDKDVYRYNGGGRIKQQFSVQEFEFNGAISGRSEADIFIHMKDGIAHYNGRDIKYLYTFPRNSIKLGNEAIFFEKEIFFCGHGRNFEKLIIHGRLDE